MKNIFLVVVLVIASSITGVAQKENLAANSVSSEVTASKCAENSDELYDRRKILEQFAEILNNSVIEIRGVSGNKFFVEDEKPRRFFVFDLIDSSNHTYDRLSTPKKPGTSPKNCIEFKDNHIYHFAPIRRYISYSHIVILENGNLKVFKSINCKKSKDKIEDVIDYLNEKLETDQEKNNIIERVKDYKKYGIYHSVDIHKLECEEVD